jgi:cell division protein FtsW
MEARLLLWLTFLWLGLGFAILASASYYTSLLDPDLKDGLFYIGRQALWIVIGLVFFCTFLFVPLRRSLSWAIPGFLICLLLIFATHGVGRTAGGATRWLSLGGFGLQPSELMKPFLVLQSAWVFGNWRRFSGQTRWFWLIAFAAMLLGILRQPNLSTTALCGISLWLIALAAGLPYLQLALVACLGVLMAVVSVAFNPYQLERMVSFTNPWQDQMGSGYQLVQSLLAIGSGGLWGTGYGFGQRKLFYLPEEHTDFIYAVFAEEFGLIGGILLLCLLTLYGILAVRVAARVKNPIYRLIAIGAMIMMLLQAAINIGVSIGALPTTGLPFPLFSHGGSSMIASLSIAGLLIRVAREGTQAEIIPFPNPSSSETNSTQGIAKFPKFPLGFPKLALLTPATKLELDSEPAGILAKGSLRQRRQALIRRRQTRQDQTISLVTTESSEAENSKVDTSQESPE